MALNRFEFFNFYEEYLWRETDFDTFQEMLKQLNNAGWRGAVGPAVLKGLDFEGAAAFQLDVGTGVAINNNGMPLVQTTTSTVTAAGPSGGQGRKSLVVIREVTTDENMIVEPTNPTNTVPLNSTSESEILVIDGTAAASPAYPSKESGDVVLFGLIIGGSDTEITEDSIDYSVSELVGKTTDFLKMAQGFDAIVGKSRYTDYREINDLMASTGVSGLRRIYIKDSDTLNEVQEINQPNMLFVFGPNVTYTKGTAATGLLVSASGVHLEMGSFEGFNGGSDAAIGYAATAEYGTVSRVRFKDCTNEIADATSLGVLTQMNWTEV